MRSLLNNESLTHHYREKINKSEDDAGVTHVQHTAKLVGFKAQAFVINFLSRWSTS